ncbi:hypothetical protein Lal_00010893 [Lupinus albus]|nr:hypothetical protein Lal_00010893 [Lupinus albus]
MSASCVVFLLLLSLFLSKVQSIRLEKGSYALKQHKQHDEEIDLLKRNNSDDVEPIPCKDKHCRSTLNLKKRVSRISRKSSNSLVSIDEDYYGPRHHRPSHH